MELAAHMRHAGSFDDLVDVKLAIASIPIRMHYAAEVSEVFSRMHALSVGAIVIGDRSGRGILVAAAIEDIDPDPAGLRLSSSWVENIDRRIVRVYSVDRGEIGSDQQDEGREQNGHTSNPVRHDRPGDVYPQPVVHLGQTVEWDMIVKFGDHDVCEQSRSRFASFDRQGRHLTRYHCIAVLTDHALLDMPDDLHRSRHMLHHLDHLVGRLQEGHATTSRATAGRCVDPLFSWKAIRQRSAFRLVGGIVQIWQQAFSGTSISLGAGSFDLLEHQFELLNLSIDLFRRSAMLPMAEQFQLRTQKTDDRVAFDDFGFLALKFRRLFSDERAQCQ